ncbi:MAG: SDR family NAD(P)-dependent oxidoreductase [Chloroflexota bacterium]
MYHTAIVTGGGSGIGLGIAYALARRGVDVALVGRRFDRLESAARRLEKLGVKAIPLQADLAFSADRQSVVERARSALGPVDLLVNNAGIMAGGDLSTLTAAEIEAAVAVNLLAPIELTRQALPDLAAHGGGVVLVGSSVSLVPVPSAAVYSATKAGVRALGESLRYELEPLGVRLLVVYPPATDTAMIAGMAEAAGLPPFRQAKPAKVGEQVVRALLKGRKELLCSSGDRAMAAAYTVAPGVVRAAFRSQRALFARMMRAGR